MSHLFCSPLAHVFSPRKRLSPTLHQTQKMHGLSHLYVAVLFLKLGAENRLDMCARKLAAIVFCMT